MRIATYQKQGLTPSEIAVKYGHLSLASPQTSGLKQFGESSGTSRAQDEAAALISCFQITAVNAPSR